MRRGAGRRAVRRLAGFGALVALASAVSPAPSAHGAAVVATGWWTATNQIGLVGPVNPTVPQGGLYVAGEVGDRGPLGVSALRFELGDGEAAEQLVLQVESVQGSPLVVACPPALTWVPEQGGPISSAPPADCGRGSVFGTLSGDGAAMAFPVAGLQGEGVLDLVLYPLDGAGPFQVSFDPPTAQSLSVGAAAPSDDGAENPGGEAFVEFTPSFAAEVPTVTDPSFLGPVAGDPTATTVARGATTTTVPRGGRATPARFTRPRVPDDRRARVASALMFTNLLGLFLWTLRAPGHAPRTLGPFARAVAGPGVVVPRGIGRFARPRAGRAPRV